MNEINNISLEALKAGDREAFSRLVDVSSSHIYHIALRFLGDPQDAEDAMQETFIKAFRSLPDFEGRSSLTTWLYRIAVNEALMALRRRKPGMVSIEEPDPVEEPDKEGMEIVDWCCLPESDLLSDEARQFLDKAVLHLSPALRAVFIMRDLEGLSVAETAETLKITESTVKTRLLRARLALRQELSIYYGDHLQEVLRR